MLAALSVAEPSDEPVSLFAREIKVPKPRQICNLNDHGTASFQQKRSKANRARWCVKEIRSRWPLPNSSACLFYFPSCDQAPDYRDNNEHRDRAEDVQRCNQTTLFGSWRRC